MSLSLRNPRVLIAFVALIALALAVVLLSAVGHINVSHMVGSALSPLYSFHNG